MSLQASKGLSAKFVIVCSQVEELIPGNDFSESNIQEQRRLFYVAITRCKAAEEFPGRFLISSFLELLVQAARRMGIPSKDGASRRVSASRYLADLGQNAPAAVRGETLLG
ncbi:MAG: hypothetical protein CML99_07205 [Rhodobiaceae bacterium]|nr:hypothetical protein [Rhodobiaceae bacterium]